MSERSPSTLRVDHRPGHSPICNRPVCHAQPTGRCVGDGWEIPDTGRCRSTRHGTSRVLKVETISPMVGSLRLETLTATIAIWNWISILSDHTTPRNSKAMSAYAPAQWPSDYGIDEKGEEELEDEVNDRPLKRLPDSSSPQA